MMTSRTKPVECFAQMKLEIFVRKTVSQEWKSTTSDPNSPVCA